MREIDYSSQFERDYKREKKSPHNKNLDSILEELINFLCADVLLPKKFRDHALKGDYLGTRECHVKPDLLLIYYKTDETLLTLVRLGSHSELF